MSIGMSMLETKSWQHGIPQETLDSVIFMDSIRFTPPTWTQPSSPSSPKLKRRALPETGWPTVDIFATGEEA
jgi:hypothetical protein